MRETLCFSNRPERIEEILRFGGAASSPGSRWGQRATATKRRLCGLRAIELRRKFPNIAASATWLGKDFNMFAGGREAERIRTTIVAVTVLLMTTIWPGIILSYPTPRDFEDCAESVRSMSPGAERSARALDCGARFAGRRKVGGGYAYYDLWQNRNFDIAGPNPTAGERTRIYADYLRLLASQRREAALAEVDRLAFEQPRGDASPDLRRPLTKRSKPDPCTIKGSLSCTWTKLKSAVGNAFASTAKQEVETR